ncbi:DNA-3-methyladenine glycosylase [Achromobacter aegrifaciens]|uniref:DNA-3-methyladenine glycosylase n=1 Tax=Achromobacter aegrifaciens TaxID=1287736 RepID=A0ABU2D8Z4_ACHAE|nr:DNA-3-methyladenine glycosylase [Achromobacter aegrifaciens]MDR7944574.1 DNA-3-methyladenine glycosylase [Achromobacter aegrifaciens]
MALAAENTLYLGAAMTRDEFVSMMILLPRLEKLGFGDWADVLDSYAEILVRIEGRLSANETAELMGVGADFYRTLARCEDYRRNAVPLR